MQGENKVERYFIDTHKDLVPIPKSEEKREVERYSLYRIDPSVNLESLCVKEEGVEGWIGFSGLLEDSKLYKISIRSTYRKHDFQNFAPFFRTVKEFIDEQKRVNSDITYKVYIRNERYPDEVNVYYKV